MYIPSQLLLSNVGELSWSWIPKNHIIQVQKEKENVEIAWLRPL